MTNEEKILAAVGQIAADIAGLRQETIKRFDKVESRLDSVEKELGQLRKDTAEWNSDVMEMLTGIGTAADKAGREAAKVDALAHEVARMQGAIRNAGAALSAADKKPA